MSICAAALAVCLPLMGAFQAHAASGYSGHWKAVLSVTCKNSPQNAKLCGFIIGQLAAIGKSGSQYSLTGTVGYTVSAAGTYTGSGSEKLSSSDPRATVHGCPTAAKLAATHFTGTCSLTATGHGHIIVKSGMPYFYDDAVEVEGYVRGFGRRRPDVSLTLLRFTNFIGPRIEQPQRDKCKKYERVTRGRTERVEIS